jgi:hypothetical protein
MIYLLFIFNFLLLIGSWAELILFILCELGPVISSLLHRFADGPIVSCCYFGLFLVSSILV